MPQSSNNRVSRDAACTIFKKKTTAERPITKLKVKYTHIYAHPLAYARTYLRKNKIKIKEPALYSSARFETRLLTECSVCNNEATACMLWFRNKAARPSYLETWPRGYKTLVQSQSSQSLHFILSLRMNLEAWYCILVLNHPLENKDH